MQTSSRWIHARLTVLTLALGALALGGCQSGKMSSSDKPMANVSPAPTPPPAVVPPMPTASMAKPVPDASGAIRIAAGNATGFTDPDGHVWMGDDEKSFVGGTAEPRPDIKVANTTNPQLYTNERYDMTSFSYKVPNGDYTVKLHFCEAYTDGISGAGQRVFSFTVQGHEFKDFDPFVKAGNKTLTAYVETVDVQVTDGILKVIFTPNIQSPQINGIEIIPKKS